MKYRSLFISALLINLTLSTIGIAVEVDVKMTSDSESVNKQNGVAEVDVISDNVKQDGKVDVNPDTKCVKKVQKPVGIIEREDAKVILNIETVQKLDENTDSIVTTTDGVNITTEIESVTVMHNGKEVVIKRNQDENNTINPEFAKTSRSCPPFCINPMNLAPGIETIAELEVLDYLKKVSSGDNSILVIDSRTPEWIIKGSIPGAVNIPWDVFSGTSTPIINKLLEEQLGVKMSDTTKNEEQLAVNEEQLAIKVNDKTKDFENAKILILFCNGPWSPQSPSNIETLLGFGYPPEKLKWYRGGMQSWESFGLTTVTDISMPWLAL
jgi:rhodanese-related sulfurtransferase